MGARSMQECKRPRIGGNETKTRRLRVKPNSLPCVLARPNPSGYPHITHCAQSSFIITSSRAAAAPAAATPAIAAAAAAAVASSTSSSSASSSSSSGSGGSRMRSCTAFGSSARLETAELASIMSEATTTSTQSVR